MSDNLSDRILHFIGNLPHCEREQVGKDWMVRRLTDGTRFSVPKDADSQEDGILIAEWSGNFASRSKVRGQAIAAQEIAFGVRRWIETGQMTDYKAEYTHLAQHFAVKTGTEVSCGFDLDQEQWIELGRKIRKIGVRAAMIALGKM